MGIRRQDLDPETWRRLAAHAVDLPPSGRDEVLRAFAKPPPAGTSERQFQGEVIALARLLGWKVAHFRPARVRRGGRDIYETPVGADGKGWPDLVLVRAGTIIFAELKVGKNTASEEQVAWLDALRETGAAAGVWRPSDWDTILEALK